MVITVRCDRMFSLSAMKVHTDDDDIDGVENGNVETKEMVLSISWSSFFEAKVEENNDRAIS